MRVSFYAALVAASASLAAATSAQPTPLPKLKPCTVISPNSKSKYDLNPMAVHLPDDDLYHKDGKNESWHARGYDYGANFTINFCAPVVEELTDVEGVDEYLWKNISAFYTWGGKTYSIGQLSTEPVFRGRKLVLTYENGSPCGKSSYASPDVKRRGRGSENSDVEEMRAKAAAKYRPSSSVSSHSSSTSTSSSRHAETSRPGHGDESAVGKKNAVISLLCDKDNLDPNKPKVGVSLVGWSPDECSYFFEARSPYACGGLASSTPQEGAVGPGGVFSIIFMITFAVYLLGGIAYQRTVMYQRGWRQIPNYSFWAGIVGFFWDILLIFLSTCSRCVPRRKGYNQLPSQNGRASSGRGANGYGNGRRDDANRLLDQLDEEWDDV